MSRPAWHLLMALALAGATAGCDTQRWIGQDDSQGRPTASTEPRLSPAFSQSGRVEADVLSPFGPAPAEKREPRAR